MPILHTSPAGNVQQPRRENELQCGFLFGCTRRSGWSGAWGGRAHQGLPALLFPDEEAGSRTMASILRHGTPLQIFPPCAPSDFQTFLADGVSQTSRASGWRFKVPDCASCHSETIFPKRPPPIGAGGGLSDADCGDPSCGELSAATCLF